MVTSKLVFIIPTDVLFIGYALIMKGKKYYYYYFLKNYYTMQIGLNILRTK